MRLGEQVFRFRPGLTLLLALPAVLFVALGLWQLDRAEQKRAEAQIEEARAASPPLRIDSLVADSQELRHRQVQVEGRFEPERQFFIEGRREGGRSGLHVITPVRLTDSEIRVLVNRGWIPDPGRGSLPQIETPAEQVLIKGQVYVPVAPPLVLHQESDGFAAWGQRWPYLTVALFAAGVPFPVQPFLILQDPADPQGFQRHWPKEPPKDGMHLGYAIQWFAFALIALVLYLKLSLSPRAHAHD
jgi:surfeit locus 1 family protein